MRRQSSSQKAVLYSKGPPRARQHEEVTSYRRRNLRTHEALSLEAYTNLVPRNANANPRQGRIVRLKGSTLVACRNL